MGLIQLVHAVKIPHSPSARPSKDPSPTQASEDLSCFAASMQQMTDRNVHFENQSTNVNTALGSVKFCFLSVTGLGAP